MNAPTESTGMNDSHQNWLMHECFCSLSPALAFLPHCILEATKEALAEVLAAANALGGILGDYPFYDRNGGIYIREPEDPEEFILWELPANQEFVRQHGAVGKLDQFTAVIDSRTSAGVLRAIYAELEQPDAAHFNYCWWIENIARWIPELGWAYIPLSDETAFAMFVAPPGDRTLVDAVTSRLAAKGIHSFALAANGHRVTWPPGEKGQSDIREHP